MADDAHWTEAMRVVGDLRRDRPALVVTVYQSLRSAYQQGKRDERDACAKVAEETEAGFLLPTYTDGQPLSSFSERFACRRVAAAIRSRSTNDA